MNDTIESFKEEIAWLDEHRAEYAGKWVAISGNELLASGENAKEVFAHVKDTLPVMVVKVDEDLPWGGW
jgi:hypothetical protein